REAARSMWRTFSHPQGWPVIWFISEFHVKISNLLYQTLDEILVKRRYQPTRLEAIWRVIQPCDPAYCSYQLLPMPEDIPPLVVADKEQWIANCQDENVVIIEESPLDDWVTAFEFRQLAQDTPYHAQYVTQTHIRSALVPPEAIDRIAEVESECWAEEVGTHHPAENLTWRQFREALLSGHQLEPLESQGCLPFTAFKEKHIGFLGFHATASFSSHLFRTFSLVFNGVDVFDGDDRVGRFEAWQEGYPDEDYDDQPLAFGVRFQVTRHFVQKVCEKLSCAFAVRTIENRFVMEAYKQEPAEKCSRTTLRVWPIPLPSDNKS
ncbi:MAG: hypothetical protein K8T25_06510, partial [Planctomycetia bacterium]|nr:hypothetical protein [Planctomycetia bacterium]